MKKKHKLGAAIGLAALLATAMVPAVQAEDLAIPVGSQADRSAISLPANGTSQALVRQRWGNPLDIQGPVGQPPISQWHYSDFVVYFERDLVMHAVVKRPKH